jgi:hypothetical protein
MTTTITAAPAAPTAASASSNLFLNSPITNPSHASTTMQNGQAVFENDDYKITCDDNNTVTITNKQTGAVYQAAGDPHVSVNGQHQFDFWGTTTFNLDDGTKVTIQTTPYAANPNADLSSKVTITNGSYGVQISGVDSNTQGDLAVHEYAGWGNTLDSYTADGNEINENATGNGFVAVDAQGNTHAVDQNWINATDVLKNPSLAQSGSGNGGSAQGQLANAYKDAFRVLSGLINIVFHGVFQGNAGNGGGQAHPDHGGNTVRPIRFEPWLGGGVFAHADVNVNVDVNVSLKLGRMFA